jgi:hypothetical protein
MSPDEELYHKKGVQPIACTPERNVQFFWSANALHKALVKPPALR